MSIEDELKTLQAPRKVIEAGVALDEAHEAGMDPPDGCEHYVREWVTRNRACNRYGKQRSSYDIR